MDLLGYGRTDRNSGSQKQVRCLKSEVKVTSYKMVSKLRFSHWYHDTLYSFNIARIRAHLDVNKCLNEIKAQLSAAQLHYCMMVLS